MDTIDGSISVINAELREALVKVLGETRQTVDALGSRVETKDKFFRNGIELLYIKVEAALNSQLKLTAELKLVGPKPTMEDAVEA